MAKISTGGLASDFQSAYSSPMCLFNTPCSQPKNLCSWPGSLSLHGNLSSLSFPSELDKLALTMYPSNPPGNPSHRESTFSSQIQPHYCLVHAGFIFGSVCQSFLQNLLLKWERNLSPTTPIHVNKSDTKSTDSCLAKIGT